mmetsp:Transcript_13812/g.41743  ORF Transcript_13812/g.41743 Transcript_13812/m.41743 type:complete len:292 (+) Transcript_13812:587-1462(+)
MPPGRSTRGSLDSSAAGWDSWVNRPSTTTASALRASTSSTKLSESARMKLMREASISAGRRANRRTPFAPSAVTDVYDRQPCSCRALAASMHLWQLSMARTSGKDCASATAVPPTPQPRTSASGCSSSPVKSVKARQCFSTRSARAGEKLSLAWATAWISASARKGRSESWRLAKCRSSDHATRVCALPAVVVSCCIAPEAPVCALPFFTLFRGTKYAWCSATPRYTRPAAMKLVSKARSSTLTTKPGIGEAGDATPNVGPAISCSGEASGFLERGCDLKSLQETVTGSTE